MKNEMQNVNLSHEAVNNQKIISRRTAELGTPREEYAKQRQEILRETKIFVKELFGSEKLPKELVMEMLSIRSTLREQVSTAEYVDELDATSLKQIDELADHIVSYSGHTESIERGELVDTLKRYFEAYRLTLNSERFRKNISDLREEVLRQNAIGKIALFSEKEKAGFISTFTNETLVERLTERYRHAGFTPEEVTELVEIADLSALDKLQIHEIKIFQDGLRLVQRFFEGDKAKLVGAAAALMVPAVLEGVAPQYLARAFQGSHIDQKQVAIYSALTAGALGISLVAQKAFQAFVKNNFEKSHGFAERVGDEMAHFPPQSMQEFGAEAVKERVSGAKGGYIEVLRTTCETLIPSLVVMGTSGAVLFSENPALGAGALGSAGLMLVLQTVIRKKLDPWRKTSEAEKLRENIRQDVDQFIKAHLEVTMSGEAEHLDERLKQLISQEQQANADEDLIHMKMDASMRFVSAMNVIVASVIGMAVKDAGPAFVAALLYSGKFSEAIANLLRTQQRLLRSLRSIQKMDLMFNGHAKEEKAREEQRLGMEHVKGNDIRLDDVTLQFGGKKILDGLSLEIPGGSFVRLDGPSGSGKTTLLKVISGYYTPSHGTASFGTNIDTDKPMPVQDIKRRGKDSLYRHVVYLSQFPYIIDGTMKENLLFGNQNEMPDDEIRKIIQEVGLEKRFGNIHEQLQSGRGDSSSGSGGEVQRLGLARVLLKIRSGDAKVIFLDEPTASVDRKMKRKLARLINREKQEHPDVSVIVISHDDEFVKLLNLERTIPLRVEEVAALEEEGEE